jgi:hypothetical protein
VQRSQAVGRYITKKGQEHLDSLLFLSDLLGPDVKCNKSGSSSSHAISIAYFATI